jgi:uncharacterized membrane protein (UPF0127 family)
MQNLLRCLVLSGTVSWAGCAEKSAPAPGTNASKTSPTSPATTNAEAAPSGWSPTKAQPKLRTMKLYVGSEVIATELALTDAEVRTGMMFRTSMREDEAMLFVFAYPHRTSFYMKNTIVPLTAAYIDPDGTILQLVDLHPKVETPVEAASDNIQFVLEMNRDWFKRHNVSTGSVISTEAGPLRKVFAPRR